MTGTQPMQLKWLEDFVAFAETRSFSQAATLRHVTQPAFGRRIRALEEWVNVDLIDREAARPNLTPAGKLFLQVATDIVKRLEDTCIVLRDEERRPASSLTVVASHTLGIHYYPKFISELSASSLNFDSSLIAVNSHEGILRLVDRSCDILISYHHPQLTVDLDPQQFPYLAIGRDRMVPLSAPRPDGKPLHALPGAASQPVPYLSYTPTIFMGRAITTLLQRPPEPVFLQRSYATDMAQALKAMMLEGRGVGWLPLSAVKREIEQGQLVSALPEGIDDAAARRWSAPLEVRLYRAADNRKPVLNELWNWLVRGHDRRPAIPSSVTGLVHAGSAQLHAETAFAGLETAS
ncbi:LysR substrate-binding domain-containing protein [Consotaella aegiceratis]|uniref:LysR substrate-binding domain-containing protein n=1 Tax=Consotaella aegiceratis TaxID=3097961 RepID=UPI002F3E60DC